jgi:hypothetical protein
MQKMFKLKLISGWKDNQYSLYDMVGRQMGITHLVDHALKYGTVYQDFLNPWCHHRWHAPVQGAIIKSYKVKQLVNSELATITGLKNPYKYAQKI